MKTTLKIVTTLSENYLRYCKLRLLGNGGYPQALSLEITQKCIAKCVMCNIWKTTEDVDSFSINEWIELLDSDFSRDLRELDITGGEPFLVKDIISLLNGIADLKPTRFPKLKSIAITTNGLLSDRVLEATRYILKILESADIGLVIVCALDAVGELHDEIRRYPNAWENVNKTIQGLIDIRHSTPHLVVGLKTTILPQNYDQLPAITQFAAKRELFTIISPIIVTAGRYLNSGMKSDFSFSEEQIASLIQFFEKNSSNWNYHDQVLAQYFRTGRISKPCSCGFNYAFIRTTGDLYLCPLIENSVGNVRKDNISTLYFGATAKRIRKKIGRMPECDHCTEPGLERYSLVFEGKELLKTFITSGKRQFLESYTHLGLDKYTD